MGAAETATAIVVGLAAGGTFTAGLQAVAGRKRTPIEIENLSVEGAQQAVASLMHSLDAETARANRAEAMVQDRDAKIAQLEGRIDQLQEMLDALRCELHSIRSND